MCCNRQDTKLEASSAAIVPHLTELGDKDAVRGTLDVALLRIPLKTRAYSRQTYTTCLSVSVQAVLCSVITTTHQLTAIFLPLTREKYKAKRRRQTGQHRGMRTASHQASAEPQVPSLLAWSMQERVICILNGKRQ